MDVVLISDHPMTLGVQFLMTHLKDQADLNVSCRVRGILASSTDFSRIECPYTVAEREHLENYLGKTKPEIVGISTIERTRRRSMLLLPAIRKILPNAFFLAGGVDAIAAPHFYLDNGIDGVAMGDGETVMEAVLKRRLNGGREALMSQVPGMITRQHPSSDPASTPDVLPMPYYGEDLLYLGQDGMKPWVEDDRKDHVQFVNRKRAIDMYTQRGCTHKCAFCAQDLLALYGKDSFRNSRRRPVEDVVRYIGSVKSNYPQKQFVYFWDLDFLRKPRAELLKFAELYRSQVGLPFFVFVTEKSVNAAGLEILTALVSAGLRTINMGIQSGNSRVLRGYNRLNTPQESESAIAK